jgi:mono/diheme cytochrome c family protein
MKSVFILLFLSLLFTACSPSSDQGVASSTFGTSSSKVDGEKIYKTYCITCHGLYGDMGGSGAFNLKKSVLPLEERINVITNGRKAMTPFKSILNEEKIKAVATYIEKLRE